MIPPQIPIILASSSDSLSIDISGTEPKRRPAIVFELLINLFVIATDECIHWQKGLMRRILDYPGAKYDVNEL